MFSSGRGAAPQSLLHVAPSLARNFSPNAARVQNLLKIDLEALKSRRREVQALGSGSSASDRRDGKEEGQRQLHR
jgi:hypothetical protein